MNGATAHGARPPVNPCTPSCTTPSLEERLTHAQAEGLEANVRRQLHFIGRHAVVELQAVEVRRREEDPFPRFRAVHATSTESAVALSVEADQWISQGAYLIPSRLRIGVESRRRPDTWHDLTKGKGTSDADIKARAILPLDFDVCRVSYISATDAEMALSVTTALKAWNYLVAIVGGDALAWLHSGNGRQIHIALDVGDESPETKSLIASVIAGANALFSTGAVKVDQTLVDAKRLVPLAGTTKKKGAAGLSDRPHRRTAIVTPDELRRLAIDNVRELQARIREDCDDAGRVAMDKALGSPSRPKTKSNGAATQPEDAPFGRVNALDPTTVAQWLDLSESGVLRCPGCGESAGVAIIDYGLKCHHDRSAGKGKQGFRTNVDLVIEVRGVDARDAVNLLADRFGVEGFSEKKPPQTSNSTGQANAHAQASAEPGGREPGNDWSPQGHYRDRDEEREKQEARLIDIADLYEDAIARAERRAQGIEKPIALPWHSLASQFGGGLWPGMHVLNSSTGTGKTAISLQIALGAAKAGVPVLYIGLELEEMQIALRILGEEARVPWSHLYLGKAGPKYIERTRAAAFALGRLPFHVEFSKPHGWPASELVRVAERLRARYPEGDIPGSRPCLIVLDFLQLVGAEPDERRSSELRERIGRASYTARDIARRLGVAVLVVSSIARDKVRALATAAADAALTWKVNDLGRPINRGMLNPEALIGIGKESGDIEYAADSVTALFRVPNSYREGVGADVIIATAKGRATGASWTPIVFTGFSYVEPEDGGRRVVDALESGKQAKEQVKADKAQAKAAADAADVIDVIKFLLANPGCSGRKAKELLSRSETRWAKVAKALGPALLRASHSGLNVNLDLLPDHVRSALQEGA